MGGAPTGCTSWIRCTHECTELWPLSLAADTTGHGQARCRRLTQHLPSTNNFVVFAGSRWTRGERLGRGSCHFCHTSLPSFTAPHPFTPASRLPPLLGESPGHGHCHGRCDAHS